MTTTPQAALLSAPNPLLKRCYTMSEPHLSGYRVVIGFERMEDAQDAHEYIAKLQATQAEPPKDVSMPQYWSVDVFSDGAKIVSIGNDWLSGERPLDEIDERTIIGAAQHLLAFVGYGLPPTSFDPDAQAEPVQAGELPDEREALSRLIRIVDLFMIPNLKELDSEGVKTGQHERDELYAAHAYARAALSARKPAVPMTDEQLKAIRDEDHARLNFVTLRELTVIARRIERAHGIGLEVKP